jgi:hypothetical protein
MWSFQQLAWIGLMQQERRWRWCRWWLPTAGISTARSNRPTLVAINSRRIHSQERWANVPQPGVTSHCTDYTPMPYKCFKNWNYCHTHGGNIDNGHTSRTCAKLGPTHNPHATRTNIMNGSPAGLHKTILPLSQNLEWKLTWHSVVL